MAWHPSSVHDLVFYGCSNVSSTLGQKKVENIKHQTRKSEECRIWNFASFRIPNSTPPQWTQKDQTKLKIYINISASDLYPDPRGLRGLACVIFKRWYLYIYKIRCKNMSWLYLTQMFRGNGVRYCSSIFSGCNKFFGYQCDDHTSIYHYVTGLRNKIKIYRNFFYRTSQFHWVTWTAVYRATSPVYDAFQAFWLVVRKDNSWCF